MDRLKSLLLLLSILLFIFPFSNAQNQSIEWQKCIGGTKEDAAYQIIETSDGGYLTVGITFSNDYDAIENHSLSTDLFVVKLSMEGSVEWTRCLGGTGGEFYPVVVEIMDGGYLISAITRSNDGDVSGFNGNVSEWTFDAWIVKIDNYGNIIWQKCYGGTEDDHARSIIQTSDGGFVFAGYTLSIDGDLLNLNFYENSQQGWIVKIDSIGTIQWQKLIGGTGEDLLTSIQLTDDGGFIVAGVTSSHDGDVIGNNGIESAWVVKLSNTGTIQWQKCIGSGSFSRVTDIKQCSYGGYIVACEKMNSVGNGMLYSQGYVIKLNNSGDIEWEKQLGGTRDDYLNTIHETVDGGFIIGGSTGSWDGDLQGTTYLGGEDFWIVKLSKFGDVEWQRRFGGNNTDLLYSLQQTTDLGYILAGRTKSNNYDVSGLHPSLTSYIYSDMWIVKLSPSVSVELFENVESIQIYPIPAQDYLYLQVDLSLLNHTFVIYSINGQQVFSGVVTTETMELHLGFLSDGIYLLKIGSQTQKFVKL
jgi:hypothetical protein